MTKTEWNNLITGANAFTAAARERMEPEQAEALDECIRTGGLAQVRLSIGISGLSVRVVAIEHDGKEWPAGDELCLRMDQMGIDA